MSTYRYTFLRDAIMRSFIIYFNFNVNFQDHVSLLLYIVFRFFYENKKIKHIYASSAAFSYFDHFYRIMSCEHLTMSWDTKGKKYIKITLFIVNSRMKIEISFFLINIKRGLFEALKLEKRMMAACFSNGTCC